MQQSHSVRPSGGRWAAAVLWACLPLFTCGLATPVTIGFAAYWLRNVWHFVAACVYFVGIGSFTISALAYAEFADIPEPLAVMVTLGLLLSWGGGVVHSGFLVPHMARARLRATTLPPHRPMEMGRRTTSPGQHHRPRTGQPEWVGHYRVLRELG
ncbi:hypothetical protein FE391_40830, partial [Nonomuraea sp. KC401]